MVVGTCYVHSVDDPTADLTNGLHPLDALEAVAAMRRNRLEVKDGSAVRLAASAFGLTRYSPDVVCLVAAEYRQCETAAQREDLARRAGLSGSGELWNVWSILHSGEYDGVLEEHELPAFRARS
jgi:hypothetical protein